MQLGTRISVAFMFLSWAMVARSESASPAGDVLLVRGHIYTADPTQPWAEAIAIRAGQIGRAHV